MSTAGSELRERRKGEAPGSKGSYATSFRKAKCTCISSTSLWAAKGRKPPHMNVDLVLFSSKLIISSSSGIYSGLLFGAFDVGCLKSAFHLNSDDTRPNPYHTVTFLKFDPN